MPLSDEEIIAAADAAGLCFPRCHQLGCLAGQGVDDDQAWISEPGIGLEERQLREEIVEEARARAADAMAQLRRFAEILFDRAAGGQTL